MLQTPLISVIVPIYNMAPWLPRCLNSIVGQTYKNLEILLIDDGSTDNSLEICQQYAEKDPRIKVIHQENKGLPSTRNTGIEHATGDFFTFVDADDWIDKNCYLLLTQQQRNTNADMVSCDYYYAFDTHLKNRSFTTPIPTKHLDPAQFLLLLLEQLNPSVCNKIYRRSWVGKMRFDPQYTIAEDWYFVTHLAQKGGRMAHVNSPLYFYYQRPQSMIHFGNSHGWFLAQQLSIELYTSSQKQGFFPLQRALLGQVLAFSSAFSLIALLEPNQQENFPKVLQARQILRKHVSQIFKAKSMGIAGKGFAFLLIVAPKITAWGCRIPIVNNLLKQAFAKRSM